MKELSIEEKAKAYDEAIERAKKEKEKSRNLGLLEFIEETFPTLKESEDDKIRKSLIGHLKECRNNTRSEVMIGEYGKWLAWLEKQGNKVDAIEGFSTEFERQVSHLIASTINKEHEYNEGYVKWAAQALFEYAKKEIEKQGEQKPTWSEEDDTFFKAIIRDIENTQYISEDAKKVRINWLKSLRPQNRWKPSDAQMQALKEVCDKHWEPDGLDPLYTLYQDLKKLREE